MGFFSGCKTTGSSEEQPNKISGIKHDIASSNSQEQSNKSVNPEKQSNKSVNPEKQSTKSARSDEQQNEQPKNVHDFKITLQNCPACNGCYDKIEKEIMKTKGSEKVELVNKLDYDLFFRVTTSVDPEIFCKIIKDNTRIKVISAEPMNPGKGTTTKPTGTASTRSVVEKIPPSSPAPKAMPPESTVRSTSIGKLPVNVVGEQPPSRMPVRGMYRPVGMRKEDADPTAAQEKGKSQVETTTEKPLLTANGGSSLLAASRDRAQASAQEGGNIRPSPTLGPRREISNKKDKDPSPVTNARDRAKSSSSSAGEPPENAPPPENYYPNYSDYRAQSTCCPGYSEYQNYPQTYPCSSSGNEYYTSVPPPPPPYQPTFCEAFSDENPNNCSVM